MILALLFGLGLLTPVQTPSPSPGPATDVPTSVTETPVKRLERVHVLGASMSAGFGLMREVGAPVSIVDLLRLSLGERAGRIQAYGDTRFYQQPRGFGQKQVQKSLHSDPTLVIAVDFAFWYGYGYLPDCDARLKLLDSCFEQLERLDCPILLGDFPDMTPALEGSSFLRGGKPMLDPRQIPDEECLAKLNGRLREWAGQRENVHIFPLSFFVAEVTRERTFEFRGMSFNPEAKARMLQEDRLHPTLEGTVAASYFVLHHLVEAGWLSPEGMEWNTAALEQKLIESTEAARAKAAEAKRKRQERKRRRQEEKRKGEEQKEGDDSREPGGEDGGQQPFFASPEPAPCLPASNPLSAFRGACSPHLVEDRWNLFNSADAHGPRLDRQQVRSLGA